MAFQRHDIFHIPIEFRHLPEAKLVNDAEAEFDSAFERERTETAARGERVHLISEDLQRLQKKLQDARDAFDAAAGLPIPAPLTQKVEDEIARLFSPDQRAEVVTLLEKQCGRTLPTHRDSQPWTLEPYRLRVLSESKGILSELKK